MFEKIRKPGRAKGIFAWIIFGFIGFIFIFIGNPPDTSLQGGGPAAVVNSEPIPVVDFVQQLEQLEKRMGIDMNQIPADRRKQFSAELRNRALETLISREVVAQSAFGAGLVVPDQQIRDVIKNYPVFQEEGRFMRERYDLYLRSVGKSPQAFEEQMRRDIAVQTMQTLFFSGLIPVKAEKSLLKELKAMQFNIEVAEFEKQAVEDGISVPKREARAFVAEEKNVGVAQAYYQGNLEKYTQKAEVKARHILVAAQKGDLEAVKKAKEKIEMIQAELKANKDFAKLAEKHSDDKASAVKGGDLGYFGKGRMVPEFEQAAFAGKVGEVSPAIQTQYGFHIIKVEDKKEQSVTPFEKVKVEIAQRLLAQNKVDAEMEKIGKAVEAGKTKAVNKMLKGLKIEWQESGPFDLAQDYIPVLGKNDKLLTSALKLRNKGEMFKELITLDGTNYVIRLKSIESKKVDEAQAETDLEQVSRSGEIFNKWIQKQREAAKIKRNQTVLSNI